MLALLYIAGMVYFGDCICRSFYRFSSIQHRLASSFLVGLLLASCLTYLGSLAFAWTGYPLIAGNIIFLGIVILAASKLPRRPSSSYLDSVVQRPPGNWKWDWLCLGGCFIFGCWLMLTTLGYHDGSFHFGFKSWSDFGANLSLSQSLVLGNNFPTEHPFFPGEIVRYHFLFWFQAANLAFLGLNLVWSVNLLSILSLMALLILIMTFAELLFESRVVGRIAAILFFFASSSLSYIPFLRSQTNLSSALSSILHLTQFLDSGYPFRGEGWGVLSVSVFAYQRHLISGVGILLVVIVFLVDFYRHKKSPAHIEPFLIGNSKIPSTFLEQTSIEENETPTANFEPASTDGSKILLENETEDDKIPSNNDIEDIGILSESDAAKDETLPRNSVDVSANQPRLISGAGILFVVVVFLVDFYRHKKSSTYIEPSVTGNNEIPTTILEQTSIKENETPMADFKSASTEDIKILSENDIENDKILTENNDEILIRNDKETVGFTLPKYYWNDIPALLFSGVLIGALPYWNGAVFLSSLIVLGSILLFFPFRRYLFCLIGMAVLVGLPQVLMLRSGNVAQTGQSLFNWGYTIANPTLPLVAEYLAWTFGFKWILIFIALWFASGSQRRLFLAVSSLVPIVFLFQLSTDAFNNHKLLNIWNVFAGVYISYALWRIAKNCFCCAILASFLAIATIFGAVIDLFPIRNDSALVTPYENDRLTVWLLENTKPSDVFLTQTLLSHPILFTGRKIFFGNTLFAWTAGYDVGAREKIYRRIFQERNPNELVRLLHENKIAYVAIDDGVRGNDWIKEQLNESIFKENFEKVFEDTERRHSNIIIYKVPAGDFGNLNLPTK